MAFTSHRPYGSTGLISSSSPCTFFPFNVTAATTPTVATITATAADAIKTICQFSSPSARHPPAHAGTGVFPVGLIATFAGSGATPPRYTRTFAPTFTPKLHSSTGAWPETQRTPSFAVFPKKSVDEITLIRNTSLLNVTVKTDRF